MALDYETPTFPGTCQVECYQEIRDVLNYHQCLGAHRTGICLPSILDGWLMGARLDLLYAGDDNRRGPHGHSAGVGCTRSFDM